MAVLGLDLDGVCADYLAALRAVAAEARGVDPAALPEPKTWGLEEWVGDHDGFLRCHRHAVSERRIFRSLEPLPGAIRAVRRLSSEGHLIRVISNRLGDGVDRAAAADDTLRWLDEHGLPWDDIAFVSDKSTVAADVYIDDAPRVIERLRLAGLTVVIADLPYNRHIAGLRSAGWEEGEPMLRNLLREADAARAARVA